MARPVDPNAKIAEGFESVVVVTGDPDSDPDTVRLAVEECPMAALEIAED